MEKTIKHYRLKVFPYCKADDLIKHGHNELKVQRWRCNNCEKSFQEEYKYKSCKPGTKDLILGQTLNSNVTSAISRNLRIKKNTVVSVLKKR